MRNAVLILATFPLLAGCVVGTVAKTAVDVVTLPVKVASAGVDAATTSQSAGDEKRRRAIRPAQRDAAEKRGGEIRKEEEGRGKEARLAEERCRKGQPVPTDRCVSV